MTPTQSARVVFYQNDKTGRIVTHKEKFRPEVPALQSLIAELERDTGILGLMGGGRTYFYVFEKGGIFLEPVMVTDGSEPWVEPPPPHPYIRKKPKPKPSLPRVDAQHIITTYVGPL